MHGHPARSFYTHSANLSGKGFPNIQPNAGFAFGAFTIETIFIYGFDDDFFQTAHVPMDVRFELIQIQNRIAYQLSGTMISDVSSPIGFDKAGFDLTQKILIGQKVFNMTAFS